ncbi:MAG TPA: HIT family protein [Thermoanaerobaculia bacterium]|jgi:histidine triad (HIT) family protein|nr:HIT family protein [Thermoanaerobaculia bacterium]
MAGDYIQRMDCVFCTGVTRSGDVVFEDQRTWVVLHDDWSVRGHAMVVWKLHVENFSDLTPEDAAHFARVHRRAENALLEVTKAERAILMKFGIATPHLHLHIYPVRANLDRDAVMRIINAETRETRDDAFVDAVRRAIGG